ncbi:MAG: glycosyltransferase [Candidatus Thioglobus sp.]|nr:glycosyltransferase [Candidatus Thioglobus sp.]
MTKTYAPRWSNKIETHLFRLIIKRFLPASFFRGSIPKKGERQAKTGDLNIEIVSHCWQYSNMLAYQLSSFVNYPPVKAQLTVTVFYSTDDKKTASILNYFEQKSVNNVTWNFQTLENKKLFRRGIGRNMAARATKSDWIWYTDCDIIFHENCLDSLVEKVQGSQEILYYPRQERTTEMLEESDQMLSKDSKPQIVDINVERFSLHSRNKAKGAFQIVHGDVARAIGYCEKIRIFQTESKHWRKTYEDTAFRWLVSSDGIPIDVDGVFQIRHVKKGRYTEQSSIDNVRSKIRRMQE